MKYLKCFLLLFVTSILPSCNDTHFESTWQDPSASIGDLGTGASAAFLLSGNDAVRRSFEYNLARYLDERGIETVAGYELLPSVDVTDKDKILSALSHTKVNHAVFMRIVSREKEATYYPGTIWYNGPYNDAFFWYNGAYMGPGFGGQWPAYYDPGYYVINTIVSVETLVQSVPDNKLIWAGMSKTMNPSKIDDFVKDIVARAMKSMEKTGLVEKT